MNPNFGQISCRNDQISHQKMPHTILSPSITIKCWFAIEIICKIFLLNIWSRYATSKWQNQAILISLYAKMIEYIILTAIMLLMVILMQNIYSQMSNLLHIWITDRRLTNNCTQFFKLHHKQYLKFWISINMQLYHQQNIYFIL